MGGLYYWESAVYGGVAGDTGGIFRVAFGIPGAKAEPFLVPSQLNGGRCVGCHSLSRDGIRMTFGQDDPDSDDEYGDITTDLIDVPFVTDGGDITAATLAQGIPPASRPSGTTTASSWRATG